MKTYDLLDLVHEILKWDINGLYSSYYWRVFCHVCIYDQTLKCGALKCGMSYKYDKFVPNFRTIYFNTTAFPMFDGHVKYSQMLDMGVEI